MQEITVCKLCSGLTEDDHVFCTTCLTRMRATVERLTRSYLDPSLTLFSLPSTEEQEAVLAKWCDSKAYHAYVVPKQAR